MMLFRAEPAIELRRDPTASDLTAEVAENAEQGFSTMAINDVTGAVVDAGLKVHSVLGPGLLESAYEACLAYELRKRGLEVTTQLELPVVYDDIRIDLGYRVDLLVDGSVVVELKTVSKLLPVHEAQLLSYLKLGDFRAGLLINFHAARLKDGIKRMVNVLPEPSEAFSVTSATSAVKRAPL